MTTVSPVSRRFPCRFRCLAVAAAAVAAVVLPAVRAQTPAAASAAASSPASAPAAAGAPYSVAVWADATFGADGRLQKLEVADEASHPAAFVARLRQQFANARIAPVRDAAGQPASFETGVRMVFEVTPTAQGGQVRVAGTQVSPRPLRTPLLNHPDDVAQDLTLEAEVLCAVDIAGRCSEFSLQRVSPDSPSVRRWARATVEGWQFAPQRVGGVPVPGEFAASVRAQPPDVTRPADFRQWQRIY